MTKKIILTTIGSLGDLHPFLAIGTALAARGARPVLAVPGDHVAKARGAGFEAFAVVPSLSEVAAAKGISEETFTRRVIKDPDSIARGLLLAYFAEAFDKIDAVAADADMIAGSTFMFAGAAVAEKRGLPFGATLLQPLAFLSDYDPPYLREFPVLATSPRSGFAVGWNRVANAIMRAEVYRRYAFTLNRERKARGVGPIRHWPMFGSPHNSAISLGLFSPLIGEVQPDFPPNSHIVGFPQFDSDTGAPAALPAELSAFLDAGAPPIVFTLGSVAVHAPGAFYADSVAAARRLGRRVVLLTGNDDMSLVAEDCLPVRYAPHSLLFPRAAVVVQHGGIGTAGQAMRSGRPQLIVPFLGDQPDNARRIAALGSGLALNHRKYTVESATAHLGRLLDEPQFAARAAEVGAMVRAERAAETAADLLLETIARFPRGR